MVMRVFLRFKGGLVKMRAMELFEFGVDFL